MSPARIPPPWSPRGRSLERKLSRLARLHAKGLTLPSTKAEQRAIAAAITASRKTTEPTD